MNFRVLSAVAVLSSLVLLSLDVSAFNSAKWLAKRQEMTADAARLREAYSNCCSRLSIPSEDVTIPLETHPDGSIAMSVHTKKSVFFQDSTLIWADGLVMSKFDSEGEETVRLEAGECVLDRVARTGWIEGSAKLVQGKSTFQGKGVYFCASNSFVSVYSDSDVFSADLKFGGLK